MNGVSRIFVSRLVNNGANFALASEGKPLSKGGGDATVPDISFVRHTPVVTWHQKVNGATKLFVGHFENAANPTFVLDTSNGIKRSTSGLTPRNQIADLLRLHGEPVQPGRGRLSGRRQRTGLLPVQRWRQGGTQDLRRALQVARRGQRPAYRGHCRPNECRAGRGCRLGAAVCTEHGRTERHLRKRGTHHQRVLLRLRALLAVALRRARRRAVQHHQICRPGPCDWLRAGVRRALRSSP